MMPESLTVFSSLSSLFLFSFLVALTGAMAPGPLLTYTIIKTARQNTNGWLTGFWVISGHAVIEMAIVLFLLTGFSYIFQHAVVVRIIGILGGLVLVCFGAFLIRDLKNEKIRYDFFDQDLNDDTDNQNSGEVIGKTIVGGALISMANPYWWVWWATIGSAFMIQYQVDFKNYNNVIAFFTGHIAGDLFWYLIVSILIFFGIKHINQRTYYGLLAVCGVFMIGFGFYLGGKPFLSLFS